MTASKPQAGTVAPVPTRHIAAIRAEDRTAIVAGLRQQGYAYLPRLLDNERSTEVCRWIDELDFPPGDKRSDGETIDFHHCVFNRDPKWLPLIEPPGVIDAVEDLLGEKCHIIGMSAWRTPPGVGSEPLDQDGLHGLHADQVFMPMEEKLLVSGQVLLPVFIMTLHYYLSDIDADLCPTWMVPGSHLAGCGPGGNCPPPGHSGTLSGRAKDWRGQQPLPVLCQAGDGLLFRSEVWHSGSRNRTTDRTRHLLQVHYSARGIAQRFPPYLEFRLNPAVVAAANPRQRRMLGGHQIGAYG